jgi:hypothetical protein
MPWHGSGQAWINPYPLNNIESVTNPVRQEGSGQLFLDLRWEFSKVPKPRQFVTQVVDVLRPDRNEPQAISESIRHQAPSKRAVATFSMPKKSLVKVSAVPSSNALHVRRRGRKLERTGYASK